MPSKSRYSTSIFFSFCNLIISILPPLFFKYLNLISVSLFELIDIIFSSSDKKSILLKIFLESDIFESNFLRSNKDNLPENKDISKLLLI